MAVLSRIANRDHEISIGPDDTIVLASSLIPGNETSVGQVINGLSLGSIYALIALGYTMVYGILRMINFAHGEIFMTGAFGDGWHRGGKLDLRLVNVVWGSDVLTVRGKVREEVPEGDKTRVVCDAWCEKPDGVKTLVGTASALR